MTPPPLTLLQRLKRIIILFIATLSLLLLASFGVGYIGLTNPTMRTAKALKVKPIVSPKRLKTHVLALTQTKKPRNHANLKSLNQAADYIKSQWQAMKLPVKEQTYKVGKGTEVYRNLITSFGPKNAKQVIVVGAHYDVCGDTPGADDNASGVAGLLEVSRLLQQHKPTLTHRIELVAYTLEEPPYFRSKWMGSAVHARSLVQKKIRVKAMICLEMLGYFTDKPNTQSFPFTPLRFLYPTTGNFLAIVGRMSQGRALTRELKIAMRANTTLKIESINAPAALPGIDFSDHLNYWKYNIPAVMLTDTSFFRNKHYHKKTDTPDTLNYKKMAEVVKATYAALVHIAKLPTKSSK